MCQVRESIWSISAENLRLYSVLFPVLWIAGTTYYATYMVSWQMGWIAAVGQLMMNIGIIGVSSAVFSMIIIAGKEAVMVLFDWRRQLEERKIRRVRAEMEAEVRAEVQAEWQAWQSRKDAAESEGMSFDEPSPADKYMSGMGNGSR